MALAGLEKLSNRERMLIGLGIIALLFLVADRVVVREIRNNLRRMSIEAGKTKERLGGSQKILAQRKDIEGQFSEIKGYVPPSGSNVVSEMSTEIEKLATDSGVSLLDRKEQPVVRMDFFDKHTVKAEMEGPTDSIMKFLQAIESSVHLLRVSRLEFTRVAKGGEKYGKGTIMIDKIVPKDVEK